MPAFAHRIVSLLTRLAHAPIALVIQLADDADDVWEPFLHDDPTGPHLAMVGQSVPLVTVI